MKLIFDFLENHYNLVDDFEIVFDSKLYACVSCQRYIAALKTMTTELGNPVKIESIANIKAKNSSDYKNSNK